MISGNAYAAGKAALEAQTVNLAAELAGSGVTVNAYRPGIVDTGMQRWIRDGSPEAVDAALRERFARNHESGRLITPEHAASALVRRLGGVQSGEIWDVGEPV
jgi:NAD(P)-dependent dehydrogenase (short-subunit alcohol dehydrogenase family)